MDSTEVNRVRCITLNRRTTYRLRVEDPQGNELTPFVEVSKERAGWILQYAVIPGVDSKEDLISLEGGDEDYRLPIRNERILRERLSQVNL